MEVCIVEVLYLQFLCFKTRIHHLHVALQLKGNVCVYIYTYTNERKKSVVSFQLPTQLFIFSFSMTFSMLKREHYNTISSTKHSCTNLN